MKFQLVLQLPISTLADFDRMIKLEGLIRDRLGSMADVDGHDAGSGEGNIFIFTNDPRNTFSQIKAMPEIDLVMPLMKAAYHEVGREPFTILHPTELEQFHII